MLSATLHPFGALLKLFRKRQKISQNALAEALHLHRNTVGAWERGDRIPEHRDTILEIAKILHLREDEQAQLLESALFTLSTHWLLPYQRNPFFTGRESLLLELFSRLRPSSHASTVLSGMGGIGKTQITIEYAYRYHYEYTAIFWITAETEDTLFSSFLRIAEHLQLPETREQPQKNVVSAVLRWLTSHRDWLLIFDNVENSALIKTYLPSAPFGSLLLTSRLHTLDMVAHSIRLKTMGPEEGTQFLLQRSHLSPTLSSREQLDPSIYQSAQDIVTIMDGLPLALDQAGAYIERTGCSTIDYLHIFQGHQEQLLDERSATSDHPLSVTRTILLSFEQMNRTNPAAADLLRICAFLAPDAIPEELFTQGAARLGPILGPVVSDTYLFNQMVGEGLQSSLLHRDPQSRTLSLHRLVQVALNATMDETTLRLWGTRTVAILSASCSLIEDERIWSEYARYLPHTQYAAQFIEHLQIVSSDAAQVLYLTGRYLYDHANFKEAETFYQRSLSIWEQIFGPDHLLIASPLERLGDLYREQSHYKQAEEHYLHALLIWERSRGPDDLSCALALNGLALVYTQQGHYEQAKPLFQRCLRIRERELGTNHPLTAYPLHNLGIIEQKLGHFDRAEPIFLRVLQIREQELGPDHPRVAFSYYGLGLLACEQGHFERAERFFQRCLQIREQAFGPDHPQVAYPLHGLGGIYLEQGGYERAKDFLQRALQIWEQTLGSTHHHLGFPLYCLGIIALELGDYTQAEAELQRCLLIWEQSIGTDHSDLVGPLSTLGTVMLKSGHFTKAEQLYQRCLHLLEQEAESEHPKLAFPLNGLANLYREQGKYQEALDYYQQALKIREQHLAEQHPDIAETLHDFACCYVCQQEFAKAQTLFQRALAIRKQNFGADHPKTKETLTCYLQLIQKTNLSKDAPLTSI